MSSIQSGLVRFLLRRSGMFNKPLDEIRRNMENLKSKGLPEGITVKEQRINGVACEVITNSAAKKDQVILYFHGGGFCLGIYPSNREFVARIAKKTGCNVFLPDYRLAPENPFPAALQDAMNIYIGILEQGYEANNIIIMGDSSGCALALSALLELKYKNIAMPRAIGCITPVFDLTGKGTTFHSRAKKDPFQNKSPLGMAGNYLSKNDSFSYKISPLYGELYGLPPILIHAADYDVFLDDSLRMKEMYEMAGEKVTLKVYPKMWHIFHMQEQVVPEAKQALDEMCAVLMDGIGK